MMEFPFPEHSADQPVLVVGAVGLDMIGLLDEPPQSGSSNPAKIRVSYGGVGRNVAENLARLGQPVRLVSAVGRDQQGQQLLAYTASCGVQVDTCLLSENYPTGSYLVVLDDQGQRYLALEDMRVLSELTPAFIRRAREHVVNAPLIFMDANLPVQSIRTLLQMATKAKVPVYTDTTSPLLAERLVPYLHQVSMISANSAEASCLCQNDPVVTDRTTALQAARLLVNRGVSLAIITLAEFGVVYATSETSGHVPAISTRVVDPTGAGDALTATVIFGLLNGIPIDESVRLGVTAASLILRYRGTVLPGLSLEKLYDELVV